MSNPTGDGSGRGPRLPRWTRPEILVLIEGKRAAERPAAAAAAAEPKWAAVSAYCRRRGVDRGAVQCRKRWSNLAGDFKKIKEWEMVGKRESFWGMRNDVRRDNKLPGFFDRQVFDILDGAPPPPPNANANANANDNAVFDSGRTAGDDALFSDYDEDDNDKGGDDEEQPVAVTPISEKRAEASHQDCPDPGTSKNKHPADDTEKGSPPPEGHKRQRRASEEADEGSDLQGELIKVFERNSRILTAHLEAQNASYALDRDQRKEHGDGLLLVLGKLADALGRIADKL